MLPSADSRHSLLAPQGEGVHGSDGLGRSVDSGGVGGSVGALWVSGALVRMAGVTVRARVGKVAMGASVAFFVCVDFS